MIGRHDPRRHAAPLPPPADPIRYPDERSPRWRLRVFDRCWGWRATRREALQDALLSRNATVDGDGRIWLDGAADVQRDPPPRRQLRLKEGS